MNNAMPTSKAICAATLLAIPVCSDWNDKMFSYSMTTMPSQHVVPNSTEDLALASCSILNHRRNIITATSALVQEYGEHDWDGYGANPVSMRSIQQALFFAYRLPATIEEPDVGVDADGEVTYEWNHDRDNQCILTFGSDDTIYCNQKANGGRVAAQYHLADFNRIMAFVNEVADNV